MKQELEGSQSNTEFHFYLNSLNRQPLRYLCKCIEEKNWNQAQGVEEGNCMGCALTSCHKSVMSVTFSDCFHVSFFLPKYFKKMGISFVERSMLLIYVVTAGDRSHYVVIIGPYVVSC